MEEEWEEEVEEGWEEEVEEGWAKEPVKKKSGRKNDRRGEGERHQGKNTT